MADVIKNSQNKNIMRLGITLDGKTGSLAHIIRVNSVWKKIMKGKYLWSGIFVGAIFSHVI
ncbi:hypothetical protein AU253_21565 [Yersinia pestis]|nr:hypothetical protein AU253_21565 [Yersinia pestis]